MTMHQLQAQKFILRPHSPWYNEKLAAAKRLCRVAERRWLRDKITVNQQILRTERIKYSNMCNTEKANYYQAKIADHAGDQKGNSSKWLIS